jgi:hypothetical protein
MYNRNAILERVINNKKEEIFLSSIRKSAAAVNNSYDFSKEAGTYKKTKGQLAAERMRAKNNASQANEVETRQTKPEEPTNFISRKSTDEVNNGSPKVSPNNSGNHIPLFNDIDEKKQSFAGKLKDGFINRLKGKEPTPTDNPINVAAKINFNNPDHVQQNNAQPNNQNQQAPVGNNHININELPKQPPIVNQAEQAPVVNKTGKYKGVGSAAASGNNLPGPKQPTEPNFTMNGSERGGSLVRSNNPTGTKPEAPVNLNSRMSPPKQVDQVRQNQADSFNDIHNDPVAQEKIKADKLARQQADINSTAKKVTPVNKLTDKLSDKVKGVLGVGEPANRDTLASRSKTRQENITINNNADITGNKSAPIKNAPVPVSEHETPKTPPVSEAAGEAPKVEKSFGDTLRSMNPLNKHQANWSTGVKDFGGTIKKGLGEYAANKFGTETATGFKGIAQSGLSSALKDGGLIDKGINFAADHGLKTIGGAVALGGAKMAGKALVGSGLSKLIIPGGLALAGGIAKQMGAKPIASGIKEAGKMYSKRASEVYIEQKIQASRVDYIPEGFIPIEDSSLTVKEAGMPRIKTDADLIEYLGDVPSDVKDKIWNGLSQLRRRSGAERARDLAITSGLGIAGGVASNYLTDRVRQVAGNPNKPMIFIATGGKGGGLKNISSIKQANLTSEVVDVLKTRKDRDIINNALAGAHKFSTKNPKLTAFLLGGAATQVGPYAFDQATRSIGEVAKFGTSQYNNLNYGYAAPQYNPYQQGYGGGGGGYYGY